MKEIFKANNSNQELLQYIQNEIEIMSAVNCKNIIKLYYYFEDEEFIYLILELAANGQLYRKMVNKKGLNE